MVWSYSRINSFENCPYGWLLKYIKVLPETSNFYAEYGKFMHHVLQKYFLGELKAGELPGYYISKFVLKVKGRPQKASTYSKYFIDGLNYLTALVPQETNTLGIEREVEFQIGDYPAHGFIDLEESSGGIILTDHKSADIKPKSNRKKPTQADIRLDKMFRQLYLYSLATYKDYGEYPKVLRFNAFRNNLFVEEEFNKDRLDLTVEWAKTQIEKITYNEDWSPNIDYFYCNFLCDMREHCEYYRLNRGD